MRKLDNFFLSLLTPDSASYFSLFNSAFIALAVFFFYPLASFVVFSGVFFHAVWLFSSEIEYYSGWELAPFSSAVLLAAFSAAFSAVFGGSFVLCALLFIFFSDIPVVLSLRAIYPFGAGISSSDAVGVL